MSQEQKNKEQRQKKTQSMRNAKHYKDKRLKTRIKNMIYYRDKRLRTRTKKTTIQINTVRYKDKRLRTKKTIQYISKSVVVPRLVLSQTPSLPIDVFPSIIKDKNKNKTKK